MAWCGLHDGLLGHIFLLVSDKSEQEIVSMGHKMDQTYHNTSSRGDLYARYSAIWMSCMSFVVFAIGCAVAGAAPTMDALIVGRAIYGVGGSGMYFGSMGLLAQMTSDKERSLYLNLVDITFGAGTVLGPVIGGAFAGSDATWRWALCL